MPVIKISKRTVDAITCPEGKDREWYFDSDLKGFAVVVFTGGRKVFYCNYRKPGRANQSRPKIGDYGTITPDEARTAAKKILGSAAGGLDLMDGRRQSRAMPTFIKASEDFISSHVEMKRKPRTAADYQAVLNNHINPAIGDLRLNEIEQPDIAKLHEAMHETPYLANRALAIISSIWNWAASHRKLVTEAANPAKGIERYKEEGRERYLTREEFGRLGETMIKAQSVGIPWQPKKPDSKHLPKPDSRLVKIDEFAIAAIRLLIFTGARAREIIDLEWSNVDPERGIIFLPDAKAKSGKRPIYLSDPALEVLASIKRVKDNPYVICGEKEGAPRSDIKRPWQAIREHAGLGEVRLHDLRHSFASFGAGASLGLPIIGSLLGHRNSSTTAKYAHLDADPVRKANEHIGASIAAALAGKGA